MCFHGQDDAVGGRRTEEGRQERGSKFAMEGRGTKFTVDRWGKVGREGWKRDQI